MALDDSAIDAAVTAYAEAVLQDVRETNPNFDAAAEQDWRDTHYENFKRRQAMLFKAIYEGILAHAEISPDGTPPLEAGGDPVTGKAKIA